MSNHQKPAANLKNNDVIEIEIIGLTSEAFGVGRYSGMVIFVPGALPGELVCVRICECKKNFAKAALLKIISPSPNRQESSCPVYQWCGGCALQHVDYAHQLELKRDILSQTLRRLGDVDFVPPLPLAAQNPWQYRNRVHYHVQVNGDKFDFGFYNAGSHDIIEYDNCQLLKPGLLRLTRVLREELPLHARELSGLRGLCLRTDIENGLLLTFIVDAPIRSLPDIAAFLQRRETELFAIWQNSGSEIYGPYGAEWRSLVVNKPLLYQTSELELELSPGAFCQVNYEQAEKLYALVRDFASLEGNESLLDLYSGVGVLALLLAKGTGETIGAEAYAPAVAAAQKNALRNNIDNVAFICCDAGEILQSLPQNFSPNVIVLDPPRSGCSPQTLAAVKFLSPDKVIYVSCNPATLARDVHILSAGDYHVKKIQPVDMFCQTAHVETICLLTRKPQYF